MYTKWINLLLIFIISIAHGDDETAIEEQVCDLGVQLEKLKSDQCSSESSYAVNLEEIVTAVQDAGSGTVEQLQHLAHTLNHSNSRVAEDIAMNLQNLKEEIIERNKMFEERLLSGINNLTEELRINNKRLESSFHVFQRECRSPFVYLRETGECMYFGKHKQSWANARQACFSRGSVLAMPSNLDVLSMYLDIYDQDCKSWFWLGATDFGSPRDFKWLNGTSITHGWLEAEYLPEPDNNRPGDNCVVMGGGICRLADSYYGCGSKVRYICQKF